MTKPLVFHLALLALGLAACNARMYSFSPASAEALSPKAAACDFNVVSSAPTAEVQEIGTLDVITPSWVSGDNASFKEAVREEVCKAGGDIVVTEVNGRGNIVRGVVFRKGAAAPAKTP